MIEFKSEKHNGLTLRNLVFLIYSRENFLNLFGKFYVPEELISVLKDDSCTFTVKNFLNAIQKQKPVGIEIDEEKIVFSGFEENKENADALKTLACFMNKQALELSRILPRKVLSENEKYSTRIWLVRMGMNGEKYRQTRKILLQKLDGNSARKAAKK